MLHVGYVKGPNRFEVTPTQRCKPRNTGLEMQNRYACIGAPPLGIKMTVHCLIFTVRTISVTTQRLSLGQLQIELVSEFVSSRFFYHQEKDTNGNRCRESRPPGCSPYQALPHWYMGPLRGTPNKFKFASYTRLINRRDICPDDPKHSLCNAHVKGCTRHQTGPDASSYILDNGSLELPYTCRFSMVRYKADGNVHSLHLCTGTLDSCYAL